jgi:2-polyprenyl-3-methyl-5-hydroxy-6-metoxy-1,4-benzoquinol methylase
MLDVRNSHFKHKFDVIGAFDVLGHIKEDIKVLVQINLTLKPNGLMLHRSSTALVMVRL